MNVPLSPQIHTVLIIEDEESVIDLYKTSLATEPLNLVFVQTGTEALTHLQQLPTPAVILLDLELPDIPGTDVLKYVKQQQLNSIIIVITDQHAIAVVVEMMRAGAFDYLEKPINVHRLQITLRNAIRLYELEHYIGSTQTVPLRECYHQMIGASKPMQTLYQIIDQVATSSVDVLISGESGTGKELCAQALHQHSKRTNYPFIVVNCAAISEHLLESHLFGHLKGAFTGAISNHEGAISLANNGTLFLDEIGELELSLQKSLLRFVQTKTVQKVGSNQVETVDVRIVCATHRDLLAEVKAGRFREDLYYRLDVIHFTLPPLRQRNEDILQLGRSFLRQFSQDEQKAFQGFTTEAEQRLLEYPWPGNVRELQNTIHHVVIFNEGKMITAEMLKARLQKSLRHDDIPPTAPLTNLVANPPASPVPSVALIAKDAMRSFQEIEKEVILTAIEYCQGNIAQAAKSLGIGTTTVYKKLRAWNIPTKPL